jgi:guanine deaminase
MRRAIRGRLLSFLDDPATAGDAASHRVIEDGVVAVADGRIERVGDAAAVLPTLPPDAVVDHHPGALVMPGFIDLHIHYPQTRVIASYGTQLLEWLQRYTFPEEQKFADAGYAAAVARFFCDELLRNGTTTVAAYCTVHPQSVDALFTEAARRNLRLIAGKVLMDRGAPPGLTDTAQRGYDHSTALIARWHGQGRLHYAVTPRFAITSTEAQLEAAGALMREHPGLFLQTHLDENLEEIAAVRSLFPWARHYTDVYDRFGLLGPRALLGHCIHLEEAERARLSETRSVAVFCPSSNLFMGSGLFDLAKACDPRFPLRTGLATDVGGGSSYSMLRTAADAYKVLQLQGQSLSALRAFYMMTLGNARGAGLESRIGSLEEGRDADLVVLDARATPAMAHRMERVEHLAEELFVLMTLGDEHAVKATYVAGERVHGPTPPR